MPFVVSGRFSCRTNALKYQFDLCYFFKFHDHLFQRLSGSVGSDSNHREESYGLDYYPKPVFVCMKMFYGRVSGASMYQNMFIGSLFYCNSISQMFILQDQNWCEIIPTFIVFIETQVRKTYCNLALKVVQSNVLQKSSCERSRYGHVGLQRSLRH